MINDIYGRTILSNTELFDALYSGELKSLAGIFIDDQETVDQFNNAVAVNFDELDKLATITPLDIAVSEFDELNKKNWFMPDEYKKFNIVDWIYNQCTTDQERNRVGTELELFVENNMYDLLLYLKYLVDTMRKNNIVWGVGRGSSTASYVLYLMGVHKINSLKYQLNINEFLK